MLVLKVRSSQEQDNRLLRIRTLTVEQHQTLTESPYQRIPLLHLTPLPEKKERSFTIRLNRIFSAMMERILYLSVGVVVVAASHLLSSTIAALLRLVLATG